ncbi:hypothetical protein BJ912DRAFT_1055321 [Pholiota molesta]|nr:hypothetical protein BJ912DRAFT_1055321 [Pholiota molesta]
MPPPCRPGKGRCTSASKKRRTKRPISPAKGLLPPLPSRMLPRPSLLPLHFTLISALAPSRGCCGCSAERSSLRDSDIALIRVDCEVEANTRRVCAGKPSRIHQYIAIDIDVAAAGKEDRATVRAAGRTMGGHETLMRRQPRSGWEGCACLREKISVLIFRWKRWREDNRNRTAGVVNVGENPAAKDLLIVGVRGPNSLNPARQALDIVCACLAPLIKNSHPPTASMLVERRVSVSQ